MLGLIRTETVPRPRLTGRLRARLRGETNLYIRQDIRWGVRVMTVTVRFFEGQRGQQTQMELALSVLRQNDILLLLTPKDFAYQALAERVGLRQPDPRALLPSMALPLVRKAARERRLSLETARIAVIAAQAGSDVMAAARGLCRLTRHLSLCAGRDTAAAAYLLRRDYGVSVVETPAAALLAEADVFILFGAPPDFKLPPVRDGAVVLELGGVWSRTAPGGSFWVYGARFKLPVDMACDIPGEICDQCLLAAWVAYGVLDPRELAIDTLWYL